MREMEFAKIILRLQLMLHNYSHYFTRLERLILVRTQFRIFLTINHIFFCCFQISTWAVFYSFTNVAVCVHRLVAVFCNGMVAMKFSSLASLLHMSMDYALAFIVVVLWKDPIQCFSFQVYNEQLFIQWKLCGCVSIVTNVVSKHTNFVKP